MFVWLLQHQQCKRRRWRRGGYLIMAARKPFQKARNKPFLSWIYGNSSFLSGAHADIWLPCTMLPIVGWVYDTDDQKVGVALSTYTTFLFNTEPQIGSMAVGLTASLKRLVQTARQSDDDHQWSSRWSYGPSCWSCDSIIVGTFIPILLLNCTWPFCMAPFWPTVLWWSEPHYVLRHEVCYDQGYSLGSFCWGTCWSWSGGLQLHCYDWYYGHWPVVAAWIKNVTTFWILLVLYYSDKYLMASSLNSIEPSVCISAGGLMHQEIAQPNCCYALPCCCSTCWRCYWACLQPRSVLLIFCAKSCLGQKRQWDKVASSYGDAYLDREVFMSVTEKSHVEAASFTWG